MNTMFRRMGVGLMLVGLSTCGCSTLAKLNPLGGSVPEDRPPAVDPNQPSIKVQVGSGEGEGQRGRIPLRKGMLVGDVLEESGLNRKFRNMQVTILRRLPDGKKIKLDVEYDRGKRQVNPTYDYALLPNDLILVEELSSTVLDDLLDNLGDPLMRRYRR